jgi:glycosyltransferase involved in cell wall biosynthesis
MNFLQFVREHASEYDLVFVTRYKVAEQVIPIVRAASPRTKIAFNLADLHFLRELREAAAKTPGYSRARAEETRRAELAAVKASDITFSYSDVELGILRRHVSAATKLAKMPWVVDCSSRASSFSATRDILFLGGFGHPPNAQAVKFFAGEVMPLIRTHLTEAAFNVIGSGARARVPELMSDYVRILGYVPSITDHLDRTRVFVAPLLAGAGLKGKVLDAISHGVPCVLSPIAVEGTGLTHGLDCLIADSKEAWAEWVIRLYTDEGLWNQISANAFKLAKSNYSFAGGASALGKELAHVGLCGRHEWGVTYQFTRPQRYGT